MANALLVLALGLAIMINLMTYALYQDQQRKHDKIADQLYSEQLKRQYFEWRDSMANGHKTDKANFARWTELEQIGMRPKQ